MITAGTAIQRLRDCHVRDPAGGEHARPLEKSPLRSATLGTATVWPGDALAHSAAFA